MGLTVRKQAFADALLAGRPKTQAAIAAGLSAKTAAQAGSRLAKDRDVLAYMEKHAPATKDRGLTMPNGQKSSDAPPGWPFGTEAPPLPDAVPPKHQTAREFLSAVVNNLELDIKVRADAAKKLIEFEEAKPAAIGKKGARQVEAGKVAAAGRYTAAAAPKLAAAHGKRVG